MSFLFSSFCDSGDQSQVFVHTRVAQLLSYWIFSYHPISFLTLFQVCLVLPHSHPSPDHHQSSLAWVTLSTLSMGSFPTQIYLIHLDSKSDYVATATPTLLDMSISMLFSNSIPVQSSPLWN
jgi:hypothetical protein